MLDNNLKGIYDKLNPIAEKNRRYSKAKDIFFVLFMVTYFVLFLIAAVVRLFLNIETTVFLPVCFSIWGILALLTLRVLRKRSRRYYLTVDEWSIFLACSILYNLEQYQEANKNQNHELEKEYKKVAVQDAKALLSTVQTHWVVGNFNLATKIFHGAISKFRKNLQTRLISNLEKEELDKETFDKIESIVYNTVHFILNPDLATLDHLNDSTFQQLNPHPLSEEKLLSRYWNYLQVHKIVKHTLAFTVIVMIAFFTFFICSYLGASTDTTLINTFFIFGTLAGVYIATFLVKREPPKTSESK